MTTGSTHSTVQLYRQLIEISMNTYNIQCQRNGFPLQTSPLKIVGCPQTTQNNLDYEVSDSDE
jgi:hypothetical protein